MIKKYKLLCVMMALAASLTVFAQGPNNTGTYYRNANNKKGAALKTALYNIIKLSKDDVTSYDGLKDAYKKTDMRADGRLRDWYSNITNYTWNDFGGNSAEGAGWNREHCVPQSWFGSGVPKSDVVHVIPTDSWVNNMRGNYPLAEVGEVEKQSKNGYSKLGICKTAGYSGKVFEPNDEIKGDIARIYFYMVTCYEDLATSWSGNPVFSTVKYPGIQKWYLDMLMRWSKQDPIDEREIARNNAVPGVQTNRNPFVDYPGLEEYIWGSKTDVAFSYDNYDSGTPVVDIVAEPVFSPNGGTFIDSVEVIITSETDGAVIYYTTNNSDATEQSKLYNGPVKLKETSTLKAIAVKDGTKSYQTIASYTIKKSGSGEQQEEGTIALNNSLFGTSYSGSMGNVKDDLIGSQDGITVIYSLGEGGSNRYCNDSQIRLYQYNTLTFSAADATLTEIEFQLATTTSKTLMASTGSVDDNYVWTGNAQQVVFSINTGSGNMQLTGVKVKIAANTTTGIRPSFISTEEDNTEEVWYTLGGQRTNGKNQPGGLYISRSAKGKNGKKIFVK